MSLFPYNPRVGQKLRGDQTAAGFIADEVNRAQVAWYSKSPAAASTTAILNAAALTAGAQAGFTTGVNSPAVARCLQVVGNEADMNQTVTVHGTDLSGATISEDFVLNGTTAVLGSKAFKTVTSVDLPAQLDADETVSVGTLDRLGLSHKLDRNTIVHAFYNKVAEVDAPTLNKSTTVLSNNWFDLGTDLAGDLVDLYYLVP